eukprot:CAMPEP_0174236532 /NCGR_PEP_ID=MMETSP0417-20130205/5635_1 /TAXON_ID=242541 /ORGANISM="Mayorella sp, Strain BSH-02190019" /LENGTH=757 /DNA_ID=CAMNT_0015315193 /DNA_START=110 /DNA_END=2380 /DNA_ORIENTATION=+
MADTSTSSPEVQAALKSLVASIHEEDGEDVVEYARAILAAHARSSISDELLSGARYALAIALLREGGDLKQAREQLAKLPDSHKEKYFALAYCHYRLGELQEAKQLLETKVQEKDSERVRFFKAQLDYKLDQFENAASTYRELLSESNDQDQDRVNELRANLIAALVQAGLASEAAQVKPDPTHYEQLYNAACAHSLLGEYERSLLLLRDAAELCRRSNEEEGEEESMPVHSSSAGDGDDSEQRELGTTALQRELGVIRAQTGVVLWAQGKRSEALVEWQAAASSGNPVAACVGSTNLVAAGESNGPLDASKRLDRHASGAELERRLTGEQRYTAHYNRALALLRLNKLDACADLLAQLKKELPQAPSSASASSSPSLLDGGASTTSNRPQPADMVWLLEAALLYRRGQEDAASALLEQHAATSAHACLGAAQQALSKGNVREAVAQLQRSRPLGYWPAAVATQARLLDRLGEGERADQVLAEAEHYWTEQQQAQRRFVITEGRVVRLLSLGQAHAAVAVLGAALKAATAGVDASLLRRLRCRLALALAHCGRSDDADMALAQVMEPSAQAQLQSGTAALNLDQLESALPRSGRSAAAAAASSSSAAGAATAGPSSASSLPASADGAPAGQPSSWADRLDGRVFDPKKAEAARLRRRKHKCKTRLPRHYKPNYVHPDPERWLPLRERSYYKHAKGRRRYVQQVKRGAAQGGEYSEEDAVRLDRSAQPRAVVDKGKDPAPTVKSAPRGAKSKKKGGRR